MCSPFSCSSFKSLKEHEYDFDEFPAPIKTPQKSKGCRNDSFRTKIKDESSKKKKKEEKKKNPYANQGLDKFSALLSELEAKKQKIYMQKNSGDVSLVYFTYTNSDELQPFIVKVKKHQQKQENNPISDDNKMILSNKDKEKKAISQVGSMNKKDSDIVEEARKQKELSQIRRSAGKSFKTMNADQRHVFGFFPATIVLILVLLCLSGRSFAIICVTVAWYLVPLLSRKSNDRK